MLTYEPPVDSFRFVLSDCLDLPALAPTLGFDDLDDDLISALLEGAGAVCRDNLLPVNATGDREGVHLEGGRIRTPECFKPAYRSLVENGLVGASLPADHGGQGLPIAIGRAISEMRNSTCMAVAGYLELAEGVYLPIAAHGSEALKALYLPRIASGAWAGAMHLTEPQAGSDLGQVRTRATPADDGTYRIDGTKIFISCADQDLTENVVNLVLARLPDAPDGLAGLSLFVVSNHLLDEDGNLGPRNALGYTGIEEKMGLHGSVTGTMVHDGSIGHLIGNPGDGLRCIFSMVNDTRLGVGFQGLGVAEAARQSAVNYALERKQGRSSIDRANRNPVPIAEHVDVRRMLNRMQSFTVAARYLGLWVAVQLDVAERHPDAALRAKAGKLVGLLTGIVKAHFTDEASACTDTAIQVFGGYGYVQEQGIEQLHRDVRVTRIYEGTNNIIAQDFARRRLWLDGGSAADDFLSIAEAAANQGSDQHEICERLTVAVKRTRQCLGSIRQAGAQESPALNAGAQDLLTIFSHISMAFAWVELLNAKRRHGHSVPDEDLETLASYYAAWRMPEMTPALERVQSLCGQ